MSSANYPAFPIVLDRETAADERLHPIVSRGLTKREIFAMAAMQGFSANPDSGIASANAECIATWAVEQADALLAELAKKSEK